jgi:hypothetical protein
MRYKLIEFARCILFVFVNAETNNLAWRALYYVEMWSCGIYVGPWTKV